MKDLGFGEYISQTAGRIQKIDPVRGGVPLKYPLVVKGPKLEDLLFDPSGGAGSYLSSILGERKVNLSDSAGITLLQKGRRLPTLLLRLMI